MWGATEQNKPGLLLSSGQEMEHDDVCSQGNWTNAGSGAHHWWWWASQLRLMTGIGCAERSVTSNNRHILTCCSWHWHETQVWQTDQIISWSCLLSYRNTSFYNLPKTKLLKQDRGIKQWITVSDELHCDCICCRLVSGDQTAGDALTGVMSQSVIVQC